MKSRIAACAAAAAALVLQTAHASPADYVYTPMVEYGEREIDFKAGSAKLADGERDHAYSIGAGFGLTPYWFTEVYAVAERDEESGRTRPEALEWENKFQLTETGRYFADLGVVAEIEVPKDRDDGYELRFGPLAQTDVGRVQLNANLLFERHYRALEAGPMQAAYQWQVKYRWRQEFEYGLQGFGELGTWNSWSGAATQAQQAGPALFGRLALGGRDKLRYNAAYLVGTTAAAPERTLRMQLEYEF